MVIFFIPIVPIIIAVLLIGLGLFGEVQSWLPTINIILMIVAAVIFIGIAIYNLCSKISTTRKIFSTITCMLGGIISVFVVDYFMQALASIEFGLLGLFEFAFVGCVGGAIALLIIMGCIWICCLYTD